MMSPLLAIMMQAIMSDAMVDSDWKVRQAAMNNLRITLHTVVESHI